MDGKVAPGYVQPICVVFVKRLYRTSETQHHTGLGRSLQRIRLRVTAGTVCVLRLLERALCAVRIARVLELTDVYDTAWVRIMRRHTPLLKPVSGWCHSRSIKLSGHPNHRI